MKTNDLIKNNSSLINLITKISVLILIFLFFKSKINGFLQTLGLAKKPEEKALDDMYEDNEINAIKDAKKSLEKQLKMQPPTKTSDESLSNALAIYESGKFWLSNDNDPQKMYNLLERVNNDSDVLLLVRAFGNRTVYGFFVVPMWSGDLKGFVRRTMEKPMLTQLNNYYQSKRIKYRF